jgi:hypothetical protein
MSLVTTSNVMDESDDLSKDAWYRVWYLTTEWAFWDLHLVCFCTSFLWRHSCNIRFCSDRILGKNVQLRKFYPFSWFFLPVGRRPLFQWRNTQSNTRNTSVPREHSFENTTRPVVRNLYSPTASHFNNFCYVTPAYFTDSYSRFPVK